MFGAIISTAPSSISSTTQLGVMISNNGNINLLREQIDLNSDLISKLERMEIQYEENQSELDSANTTNVDLNAAINLLNYELDECRRKLKTVSIERDRLSNQVSEHRVAFDLSNFNKDSSKMETTTLKDELSHKTDELRNVLSRLNELNASLKQQRTEHEQAIAVMKPELATFKDLNSKLHWEIADLIKVSDSLRNDNVLLKDHITDLTKALDGFTVKLNSESAQKNIIQQKLQEKSMCAATFERELEKAVLVIEDLRADNEDETSLFRSRQSQEKMLSIELSRVTDEKNALFADNKYLRGEIESAQCILRDQLQLRLQDRSNYEALLVASDENVQRAIDDSKDRLEVLASTASASRIFFIGDICISASTLVSSSIFTFAARHDLLEWTALIFAWLISHHITSHRIAWCMAGHDEEVVG